MMKKDNKIERRKRFEREWTEYILDFTDEDINPRDEEWNISDRDLEAYYCGCDMTKPFLSTGDKIKVKRYRREDCKR